MFNVSKILGLNGLVGLRQPLNPDYQKLDAANQTSRSGLFVTDNEFVKVEFILDGQDYASISDADFNTYLANKQNESIVSVANKVFDEVDFIDRGLFYQHSMNKVNTITLPNGFVGYRIQVDPLNNIGIEIKRVLLEFSGTGNITIQLYNTAQTTPLQSQLVTISSNNQEQELNWVVDNTDGIYKGDYYLGYLTDGLAVTPFARDYDMANIERGFTHLFIEKMQVIGHNTNTLFDLTIQEGMSDTNGINMDITVFNDYTDLIINNERLFAQAISYDLQIGLLQTSIASLRSNRNERMGDANIKAMIVQIEGQTGDDRLKITGLVPRLAGSISKIRKEIEKLKEGYFGEGIFTETLT